MNAYDPIIVAISPYHHNKYKERTTLQAMQDHKWHCVWRLLSRCTNGEHDKANYLLSTCLMAMMSKNTDVRGSYSKNLQDLEDEDLALIMLLDGCFIIHVSCSLLKETCPQETFPSQLVTLEEKADIAAGQEDGQEEGEDGQEEEEEEEDIAARYEILWKEIPERELLVPTVNEVEHGI